MFGHALSPAPPHIGHFMEDMFLVQGLDSIVLADKRGFVKIPSEMQSRGMLEVQPNIEQDAKMQTEIMTSVIGLDETAVCWQFIFVINRVLGRYDDDIIKAAVKSTTMMTNCIHTFISTNT